MEELAFEMGLKSAHRKCTHTLSRVQIHEMLKNKFYIGQMKVKDELMPHRYPPLISKEIFNRVQEIINERNKIPYTSKAWYGEKDFVLRGLIRCAHCGNLMTSERHIKKKSGRVYTYLKCNHVDKTCHQKPVSEAVLLRQIEDRLFGQIHLTPVLIKNIRAAVKEGLKDENKINEANKRNLMLEKEQLEMRKKKLVVAWLDGQIQKDVHDSMLKDIETRMDEIAELYDKLCNYDRDLDASLERISDLSLRLGDIYRSSIISEKHQILQLLLSNSVVDGKNLYFSITKPFDKLLKSKGKNDWYLWSDLNQHAIAGNRF